jgi:hypothetical protein
VSPSPSLIEETLRLYHRYQVEVVERFNLCPWAKSARTSDNSVPVVCERGPDISMGALLQTLDRALELHSDIVLLIFPNYKGSRNAFEQLVAQLIRADALRCELSSPSFAMAAFHPEAIIKTTQPEDLIPYLRSSPDPTIQLVRIAALERARKKEPRGTQFMDPSQLDVKAMLLALQNAADKSIVPKVEPSLRQKIAAANHETWQREGHLLRQIVREILDDRKRTHERLGLLCAPWEVAPNFGVGGQL